MVVDFVAADVGDKHAAIRQPVVREHVERVRVDPAGVVDVERLRRGSTARRSALDVVATRIALPPGGT